MGRNVTYSDLGLAARDQPQGLPPFSQPWALDLLEWAVALPLEPWEALATGLPPPGMVTGVGLAGRLGCFLALSLSLVF